LARDADFRPSMPDLCTRAGFVDAKVHQIACPKLAIYRQIKERKVSAFSASKQSLPNNI
jgi:hypothetical protein